MPTGNTFVERKQNYQTFSVMAYTLTKFEIRITVDPHYSMWIRLKIQFCCYISFTPPSCEMGHNRHTENWCRSTRMCDICMHFVKQSDYITNLTSRAAWVQARFMSFYLFLFIYFFLYFSQSLALMCYLCWKGEAERGSWKEKSCGEDGNNRTYFSHNHCI